MDKILDENRASLAATLTHLMSKNGLTSSKLARLTGIGQPVIYRLMTGGTENPQILTLKPIADYFGISISQLLGLASLNQAKVLDNRLLHDVTNKLVTIKTISTVLIDILPNLIAGYQQAVASQLIKETISLDIFPLLQINTVNLLKAVNSIQKLLTGNDRTLEDEL